MLRKSFNNNIFTTKFYTFSNQLLLNLLYVLLVVFWNLT